MTSDPTLFDELPSIIQDDTNDQKLHVRVNQYLETALIEDDAPTLVRDSDRVDNYGEVFTPNWLVKQMLDQIPDDPVSDLDKSALDPSCGNGQFLTEALRRKLATAAQLYAESLNLKAYQFDCLRSVTMLYGVDINEDTVIEARKRMEMILLKAYTAVVGHDPPEDFHRVVQLILQVNVILGDFLTENYTFVEWIPHDDQFFERKYWPAHLIFSRRSQRGTLFEEMIEPTQIMPPVHWRSIIGDEIASA
ncbi:MAG: N-6 DNA methylase [Bacteroidetes bacterium]|nr:N-6 DNA methylase [Bacteroidota bacterium]